VLVFRVLTVIDPIIAEGATVVAVRTGVVGIALFEAALGATVGLWVVGSLAYLRDVLWELWPMRGETGGFSASDRPPAT
jgi:energy-converting hydrogenase Eha subunit A